MLAFSVFTSVLFGVSTYNKAHVSNLFDYESVHFNFFQWSNSTQSRGTQPSSLHGFRSTVCLYNQVSGIGESNKRTPVDPLIRRHHVNKTVTGMGTSTWSDSWIFSFCLGYQSKGVFLFRVAGHREPIADCVCAAISIHLYGGSQHSENTRWAYPFNNSIYRAHFCHSIIFSFLIIVGEYAKISHQPNSCARVLKWTVLQWMPLNPDKKKNVLLGAHRICYDNCEEREQICPMSSQINWIYFSAKLAALFYVVLFVFQLEY